MADFRSILADIKQKNFAPVYILMGEESYFIDKLVEALENNVVSDEDKEFDQILFYGADNNIGSVIETASRFPMMAERQLVALKEAQSLYQAKTQLEKLKNYVANPNAATVLVIAYKGDKISTTSELLKSAKKNKDIVIFDSPKIKEYKIAEIIKDYCQTNKIAIDDQAIEVLVGNVGTSLTKIFSEIEKLRVAMQPGENRINSSIVHDHIGVSREFNNFELVNALARRNYYQAINIVKNFEVNPKANPTVVTVSVIFNFFQRLLIASFSADKSDNALMEALQLKTPYALKEIRTALSFYNASQLVRAIHAIRIFDTRAKGIDSYQKEFPLLLELVFTICTL